MSYPNLFTLIDVILQGNLLYFCKLCTHNLHCEIVTAVGVKLQNNGSVELRYKKPLECNFGRLQPAQLDTRLQNRKQQLRRRIPLLLNTIPKLTMQNKYLEKP